MIKHCTDPPLDISKTLLLKTYRENDIVRRKASFKFQRALKSEFEQTN